MNRTYSEENGLYWITINPMKIANEDEEMVKNQEIFQDLPSTGPCDGEMVILKKKTNTFQMTIQITSPLKNLTLTNFFKKSDLEVPPLTHT